MSVRVAALAVVAATVISVAYGTSVSAAPVPEPPTVDDGQVSVVNRHLAAISVAPGAVRNAAAPAPAIMPGTGPIQIAPKSSRSILLSPALLSVASHYTKAERWLHFQSHGLDANFWGMLNSGRGIRLHYTIKF